MDGSNSGQPPDGPEPDGPKPDGPGAPGAQPWAAPGEAAGGGQAASPAPPSAAGPRLEAGLPPGSSPWSIEGTVAAEIVPGLPRRRTNTMAVVAMILSLASLACGVTAPVGAVLGHVAQGQIRRTGEEGNAFALTAVAVGWIITALLVLGICGVAGLFLIAP